jgi:hypothetical protein
MKDLIDLEIFSKFLFYKKLNLNIFKIFVPHAEKKGFLGRIKY